jgi:hypothetical protein
MSKTTENFLGYGLIFLGSLFGALLAKWTGA